jgi:zinc transporter
MGHDLEMGVAMSKRKGLVAAFLLDGRGGGKPLEWPDIESWSPDDGIIWLHVDISEPEIGSWLRQGADIGADVCEAMLVENTRPRVVIGEVATVLVLRGVNLNPGADPEDMISIRILIEERRIISVRFRRLLAVEDIKTEIEKGRGPKTVAGFVASLSDRLTSRMEPVITDIEDRVSAYEDVVFSDGDPDDRSGLNQVRTEIIMLQRHLKPQMETFKSLRLGEKTGFTKKHQSLMAEAKDRVTRYVENLDSLQDRLTVLHDELRYRQNERTNRTMYLLTVVAAVLLPPSLIAGIMGANVGGIPGTQHPLAFAIMVIGILALGAFEVWLLRRLKWI